MINEEEFENNLIKFGSFLSILKNKKINHTSLLSSILDDVNIRNIFLTIVEYDNFNDAFFKVLEIHPNLARSKIIRVKYKKYIKEISKCSQ